MLTIADTMKAHSEFGKLRNYCEAHAMCTLDYYERIQDDFIGHLALVYSELREAQERNGEEELSKARSQIAKLELALSAARSDTELLQLALDKPKSNVKLLAFHSDQIARNAGFDETGCPIDRK